MTKFLLVLFLVACGREGIEERTPPPPSTLDDVRALYVGLIPSVQDKDGFVDTDECDSTLHTGLLSAGGVAVANMNAARNEEGQWFRRPLSKRECLASAESKSTLSRDMVLGLYWHWFTTKNWQDAEKFYNWIIKHRFIIGQSDGSIDGVSRILMTPEMMAQLAELIFRMGGPDHAVWRVVATRTGPQLPGFQGHLEVLGTLLWGELTGFYSGQEIAMLQWKARTVPDNALYQYANQNYDKAIELMMAHHPHDRLPTSADFCNALIYQRDEIKTCPEEGKTHAAIHFMLISKWLIERR